MTEWLTISEAADYLKVSKPTIFRWMRTGRLSFYKFGKSTRFKREQLDLVAQKVTSEPEAAVAKRHCSVCGHTQFVGGRVQSTGKMYFKPDKTKFMVLVESLVETQAMACTACGHVELFANPEKLTQLVPDES